MIEKAKNENVCNCCDTLLAIIYCVSFILFNLCPLIGQINAIRILSDPQKNLDNPNIYERRKAHFQLMLNGYLVVYLIIYTIYHLITFLMNNFESENFWKKHVTQ